MGVETDSNSSGGLPQTRRRGKRWLAVLAGINLVAVALVAAPSQAQTVTCTGTMTDQMIVATVVVPSGSACELVNVDVDGRVDVLDFADLFITESRIRGPLTVGLSSFAEAIDSRVDGMTTLNSSFGLNSQRTRFSRLVTATNPLFVLSSDSTHWGGIRAIGGQTVVEEGVVIGSIYTDDSEISDVFDTAVFGPITVIGAEYGSVLCKIGAALSVTVRDGGGGQVHIGDPSFFGNCGFNLMGSLRVDNNLNADIMISSNVVAGNLDCSGNNPAPYGQNNLVGGSKTGQCASLSPAPSGTLGIQSTGVAPRKDDILTLIAQRTGS
jgi:hypothetical protein